MDETGSTPNAPQGSPLRLDTDDITIVRAVLAGFVETMKASKLKSRERSLVITKLEEAFMWAGEVLRLE